MRLMSERDISCRLGRVGGPGSNTQSIDGDAPTDPAAKVARTLPDSPQKAEEDDLGSETEMDEASIDEKLLHYMQYSTTLSFSQPEHRYKFYIYLYIYSIAPGNDTGIIKTCYIHEHAFLCNF